MKLSAGTLLQGGKYRIEDHLGSGGFGCTYKAYYNTMGCYVAIKEFFVKDFCNREEDGTVKVATQGKEELVEKLRNKFFNEARTLFSSKMYHSNIVRVSDVFEENDTVYYVMDYIEGSTLATLIEQKGYLAEDEALRYIRQVADALKHLHANNCLHLDVKPANIMIDGSGKAVLIDFGVSKQYDEANGENTSTLLGHTPGYAPIEQSGRGLIKFNAACDIYALGATLYKALTGTTPVEATLRAGDKSLCELAYPEHVSVAIRTAIDKAMQISRGDRPQSIAEFLCLVESGKIKDESGKPDAGETVLNGNVKGASKREGENLFTHTASESSFDEVKGENGKLVADESQSIDVVEVPDSADTVISNEGEKSHSADAVILNDSEKSHSANNEILPPFSRQNDKGEKSENIAPDDSTSDSRAANVLIVFCLLLLSVVGAWIVTNHIDDNKLEPTGTINGHEYVDLGLPSGTKWATCNIGASTPVEAGDYFSWGEIESSKNRQGGYFKSNTRLYGKNVDENDVKGVAKFDVATSMWGDDWRMPTNTEFQELIDNCTWEWTTINESKGYKVTGKNGNSIFLPAVGSQYTIQPDTQEIGYYWSASPGWDNYDAYHLCFTRDNPITKSSRRYYGFSVRPVCK